MPITIETLDKTIRLRLVGEIDHTGAEELKTTFNGLPLTGKQEVVLNFKDVRFIGSAGLGKLLLMYKRLSAEKIQMRIESPSASIHQLLKELKMDTLFTVA
jgi:anti-anti-sigma factor